MTASQTFVKLLRDGARADVVLARPEARNALNLDMCVALSAIFTELAADETLRLVVLRAEGPVFCAGADLKEREGRDESWIMGRRRASFRAYELIAACPVPVICAVQGPLVGSGGEIAMSCDYIISSSAASFCFPEPQWGTIGATQRLQRVIGVARAKELLFTGRVVSAAEAYQLNLVTKLVDVASFEAELEQAARAILAAPSLALRLTKQCVDQGNRTDLANGIAIELAAIERNLQEGDWRAGLQNFNARIGSGSQVSKS